MKHTKSTRLITLTMLRRASAPLRPAQYEASKRYIKTRSRKATKNKMLEAATLLLSAWKISSPWKASEKSTKKMNEMKYRSRNASSRRL